MKSLYIFSAESVFNESMKEIKSSKFSISSSNKLILSGNNSSKFILNDPGEKGNRDKLPIGNLLLFFKNTFCSDKNISIIFIVFNTILGTAECEFCLSLILIVICL